MRTSLDWLAWPASKSRWCNMAFSFLSAFFFQQSFSWEASSTPHVWQMAWLGCYRCQYSFIQAVGLFIPLWKIETVHFHLALPWWSEQRLWRECENLMAALDDSSTWDKRSKKLYFIHCSNLKQCYQTSPSLSHPTSTMPSATFADHPYAILQVPRDHISLRSVHEWMGAKSKNALKLFTRSDRRQVPSITLAAGLCTATGWGYTDGFQSMSSSCTALVTLFAFAIRNHE